ncbi:DNA-processing protein DprA [Botrimarina hoheduenensis]|uniref:Helix-hairpin-helix DNA-binding motif class 1 domain-containing protein n=1 Tax=Botrimarina hoheduenensis TaxID=2528000 RepID=A0A5C5W8M3_9BACT|nr:DNA-processing protein DprA [Botrimarina hoheduenensis]TWT46535.1 hypothetical protein Pla111_16310 [Botrimarina hoheduenensis]
MIDPPPPPPSPPIEAVNAPVFSSALLAEVRLASVRGVGPLLRRRLIEAFGDAERVLRTSPQELTGAPGVGPKLAQAIGAAPDEATARGELRQAATAGIRPLVLGTPEYPPRLAQLGDAPPVLYCRGQVAPTDTRAIAIVGTRRASRYGLRYAGELAAGLARAGVTVVSGLARGIDAAAHRACLEAGGRTLAIMAGGLLKIYPPEHAELAEAVARRGALLAESPPRMPPMSGSFPQRNRIISGVSLGVVVVEAARRSGAMITARHAAEQDRDVFALPGVIDNPQAAGCHQLIQEGAKLITGVDDILAELETLEACGVIDPRPNAAVGVPVAPDSAPSRSAALPPLSEVEQRVWEAIGVGPTAIDTLIDSAGLPAHKVLATVSLLELAGRIERLSGVMVARRS